MPATTAATRQLHSSVVKFDAAGNVQFAVAATLNAAAADVVSFAGFDRINTRHAAAGNTVLAFQSERGSPVYLGDDALDFAATTGVVSVNGTDLLSMTSTAATLAGNLFITGTLPYVDVKPSGWASSGYIQFGVSPSFAASGNYGGLYVPAGKGIVFTQAGTTLFLMDVGGNVGLGVGSTVPLAKLESRATSGAQIVASFDASNYLSTTVSSSGAVTFDSVGSGAAFSFSDSVAIGVATPLYRLHVNLSSGDNQLYVSSGTPSSIAGDSYLTLNSSRADTGVGHICKIRSVAVSAGKADLAFLTQPSNGVYTERMRIDNAGYVGIGTTVPTSALSVVGVVKMEASSQRRPALTSSNFGYSANYRTLMLGSSSTAYNTADTGAVTLAFGVDVSGNAGSTFTGDGSELLFRNVVHFITPNSGNTNYQKVLSLNDGNVGIGTTSPTSLLTVNQAANTTDGTQATYGFQLSNQGTANITIGSNASFNYIQSWASKPLVVNSQGNNTLLNPTSGNVGIGTTSPSARVHAISTTEQLRLGYDASNYYSTTVSSAGAVTFDAVGASAGFIFNDSVGIGISPLAKFHVSGAPEANMGQLRIASTGNYGGLSFWTANGNADARNWQIQTNYQTNGTFDIMRSTSSSGNPTTPVISLDKSGNVGIGYSAFGTSAVGVLGIVNGTEPSTSPADMIQLYSVDLSAGNATLGLRTETAVVTESVTSDRTLSIRINGTTYKLCLKA